MQLAIRIVLTAAGLATVPAAAAILGSVSFTSSWVPKAKRIDMSFHDARVIAAAADDSRNNSDAPVQFAQAMDRLLNCPGAGAPGGFPTQFGLPPVPHLPGPPDPPGAFGFARPAGPPPSPRVGCEEDIDRLMGLTGYLKSKMQLQGDQKAAWQKVEQAATPGVEKVRELCGRLPSQPAPPPNLLDRIDFAEMQMTARVELLRAVHEPLQALYDTLLPDQRALLVIIPPALHPTPPGLPMPPSPEHGL